MNFRRAHLIDFQGKLAPSPWPTRKIFANTVWSDSRTPGAWLASSGCEQSYGNNTNREVPD